MSLSISSIVVGLVAGSAIGFGAAHYVARNSTMPSVQHNTLLSSPNSQANNVDSQTYELPTTQETTTLDTTAALAEDNVPSTTTPIQTSTSSSAALTSDDILNPSELLTGFSAEQNLINKIANTDFDQLEFLAFELLDQPQQVNTNSNSNSALRLIGLRMVELDKDRTFAFLESSMLSDAGFVGMEGRYGMGAPHGVMEMQSLRDVVLALAESHSDDLLAWSADMNESGLKYMVQEMVYAGVAQTDPRAALAMHAQSQSNDQMMGIYTILTTWAETDPAAAMQWSMEEQRTDSDMGLREMIFTRWLEVDAVSANAFLAGVDDPRFKANLEAQSIMMLASTQPQVALEKAMAMDDMGARMGAIEMAMYSWGSNSLFEAIDFATNSLSGHEQEMAYQVLGSAAAMPGNTGLGQSALEILQASDSLPMEVRNMVQMNAIQQYFQEDAQAAMQWLDSVPNEQQRTEMFGSIAWELAEYDLDLAQSVFADANTTVRSMMAQSIAEKLHRSNSAEAWSWYQQIGDVQTQEQVFYSLIYAEAERDPDNAMQLAMNSTFADSDEIVFSLFEMMTYQYPDRARSWLQTADIDEQQRQLFQQRLDAVLGERDPVTYKNEFRFREGY